MTEATGRCHGYVAALRALICLAQLGSDESSTLAGTTFPRITYRRNETQVDTDSSAARTINGERLWRFRIGNYLELNQINFIVGPLSILTSKSLFA